MNKKLKIHESVKNICFRNDIQYSELERFTNDIFTLFNEILYIEINSNNNKIIVDVSTSIQEHASNYYKEKLLKCLYQTYSKTFYEVINVNILTFFESSN